MAKYEIYITLSNDCDCDLIDTADTKAEAFKTALAYANWEKWNSITQDYEMYCDDRRMLYHEYVEMIFLVKENIPSEYENFHIYEMDEITAFLNSKH